MNTTRSFIDNKENHNEEIKVFDWHKAAKLIRERKAKTASAGLAGDWEYTCGYILVEGIPIPKGDSDIHLASAWATPQLKIDGELINCYIMQSETDGWDGETYWPGSARKLLAL